MNTNRIAILIKKAALEFDKIANPVLSGYDLTASQYRVMKYLYSQPDASVRIMDIEKECDIRHPTVLGLIDNLEKNGFVRKIVNPNDSRSKVISLTDKAKEMQENLKNVGIQLDEELTKNLSESEKKELLELLQKMTDDR